MRFFWNSSFFSFLRIKFMGWKHIECLFISLFFIWIGKENCEQLEEKLKKMKVQTDKGPAVINEGGWDKRQESERIKKGIFFFCLSHAFLTRTRSVCVDFSLNLAGVTFNTIRQCQMSLLVMRKELQQMIRKRSKTNSFHFF